MRIKFSQTGNNIHGPFLRLLWMLRDRLAEAGSLRPAPYSLVPAALDGHPTDPNLSGRAVLTTRSFWCLAPALHKFVGKFARETAQSGGENDGRFYRLVLVDSDAAGRRYQVSVASAAGSRFPNGR
jgi:hypothetical protein